MKRLRYVILCALITGQSPLVAGQGSDSTESIWRASSLEIHGSYWFGYASSDKPGQLLLPGMYMNQFLIGFDVLL